MKMVVAWLRSAALVGPVAGNIVVGLSAFLLLAAGPRLLGSDGYSQLAVAWLINAVFASGLSAPAELAINSAVASGRDRNQVRRIRNRLVMALGLIVGAWLMSESAQLNLIEMDQVWWLAVLLALLGSVLAPVSRGRLAGSGQFKRYGTALGVEAATRTLLVFLAISAWGLDATQWVTEVLLGLALGIPIIASAVVGWILSEGPCEVAPRHLAPSGTRQPSITITSLSMQFVLNLGPLWLAVVQVATPQWAGQLVSTNAYMRVPLLILGGFAAYVMSRSTVAGTASNWHTVTSVIWRNATLVTLISTAGVVILSALSPWGLALLYGPDAGQTPALIATVGATTIAIAYGTVLTQGLIGIGEGQLVTLVWLLGATLAAVLTWLSIPSKLGVSCATLAGVSASSSMLTIAAVSSLRRRRTQSLLDHVSPGGETP